MITVQMISIGSCLSLVAGWLLGGIANWMADHLPQWDVDRKLPPIHLGDLPHYWVAWWYWTQRSCPHCGLARPLRAPLLEVGTAVVFAVTFLLAPQQPGRVGVIWVYALLLLTVLAIDIEHRRVLNIMLAPAAVIVLMLSGVPNMPGITNALLGGLVGFGFLLVVALIGRGKLGAGDVKLAGLLGLMTGYPSVWTAVALGLILGGVAAVVLLLSKRAHRKSMMAYAPYLVLGALITLWHNIL